MEVNSRHHYSYLLQFKKIIFVDTHQFNLIHQIMYLNNYSKLVQLFPHNFRSKASILSEKLLLFNLQKLYNFR